MIKPETKGIFSNTTNEHSEILKFIKTIDNVDTVLPAKTFNNTVEEYGFPLIAKKTAKMVNELRHPTDANVNTRNLYLTGITLKGLKNNVWKLSKKWYFLIDAPFDITGMCCNILKKAPLHKFNKPGMFVGTMAVDSDVRKRGYLETGCIDVTKNNCKPISFFTKEDIWQIVKDRKIPYCHIYDTGILGTGCAYCGFGCHLEKESRFERLKESEPKRFDMMMNLKNNGITYSAAIEYTFKNIKRSQSKE